MNDKIEDNVITLNDSPIIAATKMCQGNPGIFSVIIELLKKEYGLIALALLDDMKIRGSKIWVGYKDYCKQNIDDFYELIMKQDEDMIKFINESE